MTKFWWFKHQFIEPEPQSTIKQAMEAQWAKGSCRFPCHLSGWNYSGDPSLGIVLRAIRGRMGPASVYLNRRIGAIRAQFVRKLYRGRYASI